MNRYDIINTLIEKYSYKSYLEIGVYSVDRTFDKINTVEKIGVDPKNLNDPRILQMTSDEYFSQIPDDKKFDIIFIDGDHYHEQVTVDLKNSLKHLSKNGSIVMHDCAYLEGVTPANPRGTSVCKSFIYYRMTRPDLSMYVVDTDWGCGVVRFGIQEVYKGIDSIDNITEEFLNKNKIECLNLISVSEFINNINYIVEQ